MGRRSLAIAGIAAATIVVVAILAVMELRPHQHLGAAAAASPSSRVTAQPHHFTTLRPGAALPSDDRCAQRVRSARTVENKRTNVPFNQITGQAGGTFFPRADDFRANSTLAPRVDGNFTGTTTEILRWVACKWGIDEDVVFAQAAVESWWRQTTLGDWDGNPAACAPGHGVGVDGRAGVCPESYGILQIRYSLFRSTWPAAARSTAMNADIAYAVWRVCFEGYEVWLNNVDRVGQYGPGDAWGCVGRWFAGRWHTHAADQYMAKVKDYLAERVWEQPRFLEP